MEKMVYESSKKHRIIAVKKLLAANNIPVTSIKLYINLEWSHGGRKGGVRYIERRERRDELTVPIEDFDGKLNDAQTFELYTDGQYETAAITLIEECDQETFFDDCVFKSANYDEVFEIYLLLKGNNVPCDEVVAGFLKDGSEAFFLFADPENKDEALALTGQHNRNEAKIYGHQNAKPIERKEIFGQEPHEGKTLRYILLMVIAIACISLFKINNEFIIKIIIKNIIAIITAFFEG